MEKMRILGLALIFALITIAIPISGVKAQETYIFGAYVYSNGTPVTTPMSLASYRQYHIVVYGVFSSGPTPFPYTADAQYYTTNSWGISYQKPYGHSFLQINGQDVEWGMWSDTPSYHTYSIYITGTNAPITFRIIDWIDGDYSNNQCHLVVKIYEGPFVPPEGETAYAYGGAYAHCFLSLGFKNWGWSNGPLGSGSYEFDIYAGAAKCDITKGDLVGTLTVNYDGSTATVTYTMDEGWMMDYTQLYVGSEILPRNVKGQYTTSPGQYPYIHYLEGGATTDTYTVVGLSGSIYVVAHADVFEA